MLFKSACVATFRLRESYNAQRGKILRSIALRSLRMRGLSLSQESCSACAASLACCHYQRHVKLQISELEMIYQSVTGILQLHNLLFLRVCHYADSLDQRNSSFDDGW